MQVQANADAGEVLYQQRRRAVGVDPAALPTLRELGQVVGQVQDLEERRDRLVREARERGATWAQLGGVLGVSQQAVQKRYGA